MSDGALSQDEIDALLQGSGAAAPPLAANKLDAFREFIKTTVDTQKDSMTGMISDTVQLTVDDVLLATKDNVFDSFDDEIVKLDLNFTEGVTARHSYIMPLETATVIASLMIGQDEVDFDDSEAALSALGEAANTLAGVVATAFGNKINKTLLTEPANSRKLNKDSAAFDDQNLIKVDYTITVDAKPASRYSEIYSINMAEELSMSQSTDSSPSGGGGGGGGVSAAVDVQGVQLPELSRISKGGEPSNIGLLMDVFMEVTVEIGRTRRKIKDILSMGEGTIVELDKAAGESVDILVNHKLIARGEIVVIDENFGVRVTEIVDPLTKIDGM